MAIPETVNSNEDHTQNDKVGLSFQHMLSQVKFTFKNTDSPDYIMKISDIKVKAVKNCEGSATYGASALTFLWNTTVGTIGEYDFGELADIAKDFDETTHSTTCFVIPQDNEKLEVSFTATFSDQAGEIKSSNFKGKLAYTGTTEGTTQNKWTPGFRYNYTVTINGSTVKPDLKDQIIEFKVDAVKGWVDTSNPEEVQPEENKENTGE